MDHNIKNHTLIFRTIIVGDSMSGKTSFCKSYNSNNTHLEYSITIGVDFISKRVKIPNGPLVKLQIWDTAGQEAFRAIIRGYYRNICGAIIMFDLTNKKSFDNIKSWLKDVRNDHYCIHNHPIILVGNKCDLSNKREISYNEALTYAESEGIPYMECSCNDVETINNIMLQYNTSIYENYIKNVECLGVYDISDNNIRENIINHIDNRRRKCCLLL